MKSDNADPLLLTVEQAAKLCQISRDKCYEMVRTGGLPHVRFGRVIRVPRFSLEQWIARQAGLPDGPAAGVHFPQQGFQQH